MNIDEQTIPQKTQEQGPSIHNTPVLDIKNIAKDLQQEARVRGKTQCVVISGVTGMSACYTCKYTKIWPAGDMYIIKSWVAEHALESTLQG
jgi:hypothetical protein